MRSVCIKMVDMELMRYSTTKEILIYIDRDANLFTVEEAKRGDVLFFCDLDRIEYAFQGLLESKEVI